MHDAAHHLNGLISNVNVAHIEEQIHEIVQCIQPGSLRRRYFHRFVLNQLDDGLFGSIFANVFDDIVDSIQIGGRFVPLQQLFDFGQRFMEFRLDVTVLG